MEGSGASESSRHLTDEQAGTKWLFPALRHPQAGHTEPQKSRLEHRLATNLEQLGLMGIAETSIVLL